ncbi:universal stress protein [Halorussus marinus]|uniref:universal stress protein n=1 Tax=Halorussus marinus TaxID=2505976 RepID=UPI00106EB5BD|nr:universal stress protein [Halorussus marinus]
MEDRDRVAVAVGNPDNVDQLVRTAIDVARDRGGEVVVVAVRVTPRESPFGLFTDEVIARELGGERRALLDRAVDVASGTDVPVRGRLFVAGSVADGVLHAIDELDCGCLVVGWQDRTRENAILGTNVDRIVRRADADVLVEKIGAVADGVEAVLLPVAESPNADLAAAVARAIAAGNDARVDLLRVADSPAQEPAARELLADASGRFGSVPVETEVRVGDVADAIVAASADRDVTVLGATRTGQIRRRVVGSTPRAVGRRAEGSVIVAKKRTPSLVGRLLGR